jgi:hypothetical protein
MEFGLVRYWVSWILWSFFDYYPYLYETSSQHAEGKIDVDFSPRQLVSYFFSLCEIGALAWRGHWLSWRCSLDTIAPPRTINNTTT